jgi:hypothetical protein
MHASSHRQLSDLVLKYQEEELTDDACADAIFSQRAEGLHMQEWDECPETLNSGTATS